MDHREANGDAPGVIDHPAAILVVDDDEGLNRLIRRTLERARFRTDSAFTGSEAICKLLGNPPDLMLLDFALPDMTGEELIEISTRKGPGVPFIILTGQGDEKIAVTMMKMGARNYLVKGLDLLELLPQVVSQEILALRAEKRLAETERTLRESERKYRLLVETAQEGIWVIDCEEHTIFVNAPMAAILGYTVDEMMGKHLYSFMDERGVEISKVNLERRRRGIKEQHDFELLHKDGTRVYTIMVTSLVIDDQGCYNGAVAFVVDVTERRMLEEKLLQSQKMEVVGQLAGGIAHDFNNLLTAILGYAVYAMTSVSQDDPVHRHLEEIQAAAERAAELTRQLLTFARRDLVEPRSVSCNDCVLEITGMLHRLIGENIELVTLLSPDLGTVKADLGHLGQVIVNMAVNARDAMPGGGTLSIETSNLTLDSESALRLTDLAPGPYVKLSIRDTGIGMAEDVRARVFEPFYTTKGPGKGTGLGLATCYGIVKESGGDITVWSEPGKGSTFDIYLPRLDEAVGQRNEDGEAGDMPNVMETLLLVEDEPMARWLRARALRQQGYLVLEASNGAEALSIAEEHADDGVHLLLTGLMMPQMGGRELAGRIREIFPESRVIFTFGHGAETAAKPFDTGPDSNIMQEPFEPEDVARMVREVLDAPQRGPRP